MHGVNIENISSGEKYILLFDFRYFYMCFAVLRHISTLRLEITRNLTHSSDSTTDMDGDQVLDIYWLNPIEAAKKNYVEL